MIRLLQVIRGLSGGGAARSLLAAGRHLAAAGDLQLTVLSLQPVPAETARAAEAAGLRVLGAPDRETVYGELAAADLVQVDWWNVPELDDLLRSPLPPMRLILFFHVAGDVPPNVIRRELVDFADFCIACCPYTYRTALEGLPPEEQAEKAAMVWATTDFTRLEGLARRPHAEFNVGYIGTVDFKKIHPRFVAMSARVAVPGVRFLVCGKGEAVEPLQREARRLGAADRFDFQGYAEDLRPVLEVLDVYGYPLGENPAAELNIQEVMYAGIPVVAFPRGGLRDLVLHEFTGLAVRTEAEYAAAIEHLYRHPEERLRLGSNARSYALQMFGGEITAGRLRQVYERVLRRAKRARRWPETAAPAVAAASRGARRFAESLDGAGRAFRASLEARAPEEVLAAEREIAASSRMQIWGLREFAAYYPDDPYLSLWLGIALQGAGERAEALERLRAARALGLDAARLDPYLARRPESP